MTLPYVSVIVPVFNSEGLIENCLGAIKGQEAIDLDAFELIVVDDASTDSSGKKAHRICDKLITLERNSGAATSRNRGAVEAAGDILIFVDADVILEPLALSKLLSAFKKDQGISAAVGSYTETPADPGLISACHNAFTLYHHDLSLDEMDWFWGALGAVRKEAFMDVGGFDERYRGASCEDMELGLALSAKGHRIVYYPEAKGSHARHFTFFGMLENDYKKAVLGTKLRLAGRLPKRAPGFVNFRNLGSMSLLALSPLPALMNIAVPFPHLAETYFVILLLLLVINLPYYRHLRELLDLRLGFVLAFLHWAQLLAILAGALAGVVGHILGRSTFGRPSWI
jgi:glycosyltransferase involved in cell wall biosynthesis